MKDTTNRPKEKIPAKPIFFTKENLIAISIGTAMLVFFMWLLIDPPDKSSSDALSVVICVPLILIGIILILTVVCPYRHARIMDLHDYLNVRRVFRTMASEWNCPVWIVKLAIRRMINNCWEKAMSDPDEKVLWDQYFPNRKPTPDQYILMLGHAHERGEDVPVLLKE